MKVEREIKMEVEEESEVESERVKLSALTYP